MKTTSNLGLKKPEGTDIVDISDLNGNMDTLDTAVKSLQDQAAASVPLTQKGAASGVASLDASAKLPAGQLPSSAVQATTADVTYYVRTDGSDGNNGLANTAAGAFKTIGKAISMVPLVVNHVVTINVAAGTYVEDLSLKGLVGKGSVSINGDSVVSTSRTVNRIEIHNCSLITAVTGFNCSTAAGNPVTVISCSGAVVDRINSITSQPDPNSGIVVNLAFARIAGCNMSNKGRFITVVNGGKVYVENCGGLGNYSGYVADLGGNISFAGTQPSSTIGNLALNGGTVNQNILNPWGDNTQTSRPILWAIRGSNQVLSAGAWNTIIYDGPSTVQNLTYDLATGKTTITQAGWYKVYAKVLILSVPPNSQTQIRVVQNSVTGHILDMRLSPIAFGIQLAGEVLLYCGAGDDLVGQVYVDSALTIRSGGDVTCLQIIRVA